MKKKVRLKYTTSKPYFFNFLYYIYFYNKRTIIL